MSNLLLIDTRVSDIDYVTSCLTENTDYILFDYLTDTFDTIQSKITGTYVNVGLVSHNTTQSVVYNTHYIDLSDGSMLPVIYDNINNWYVDHNGNKYRITPSSKIISEYDELVTEADGCTFECIE